MLNHRIRCLFPSALPSPGHERTASGSQSPRGSLELNIYLFIWLYQVLVAAPGILSCGMWDLVPWPGIEPRLPALEALSLNHWTTREVPSLEFRVLLLLLLSRFSRVQLCATPYTAAHQAPPSLGFSGQEHWSGLPFPSPMHESEKWKWSHLVVSDT